LEAGLDFNLFGLNSSEARFDLFVLGGPGYLLPGRAQQAIDFFGKALKRFLSPSATRTTK